MHRMRPQIHEGYRTQHLRNQMPKMQGIRQRIRLRRYDGYLDNSFHDGNINRRHKFAVSHKYSYKSSDVKEDIKNERTKQKRQNSCHD